MAKLTLLEIVQDILNDLDSDEVNSITDTIESQQVAQIVKTTFNNIIDGRDWPHLKQLLQLDSSGTASKPVYMRLPENVVDIDWVKYNTRTITDTKDRYTVIKYKTPEEFLDILEKRDSSASNVTVVTDDSGASLNIFNDTAPVYFTSFDDEYLVFDAYDTGIDTTLQNSKSQCFGKRIPTFTISDSFIPDLPTQMFSYLLNESKSTAFMILKQSPNAKAEQHSITQRRRMSQEAWRINSGITYPNYGRK